MKPELYLGKHTVLYVQETKCALCGYGFPTVDGQKQFWEGKDGKKFCCTEHAEFGVLKSDGE